MLVIIEDTYARASVRAAGIVASKIQKDPRCVLGLATGNTPVGLYNELIRLYKEGLDFSAITTFNLDEYFGISKDNPLSFYRQIHKTFLDHVNITAENVHIPDGSNANFKGICDAYESAIENAGGIDLQILGIGRTGHIGFNEPTSSLASRTRLKTLSKETIEDNRKLSEGIPTVAITMGIATILQAKQLLLIASGEEKAEAVAKAIEGPISSSISASALQMHPDVTVLLDNAAAAGLEYRDYYDRVVEQTAKFSPERLGLQ